MGRGTAIWARRVGVVVVIGGLLSGIVCSTSAAASADPAPADPPAAGATGALPGAPSIGIDDPLPSTNGTTIYGSWSAGDPAVHLAAAHSVIYPLAVGYRDHAEFALSGLLPGGRPVTPDGYAVLRHGKAIVKTWRLTSHRGALSWDGRIGGRVVPGVYHLTLEGAPDGARPQTWTAQVLVSKKHLARATVRLVARASARGDTFAMPRPAAESFQYGPIAVRIRTSAVTRGSAAVLLDSRAGTYVLVLRNGRHETGSIPVPVGVTRFTARSHWAPGAVGSYALQLEWTYEHLVD